jgi:hypothetical protein
MISTNCHQPIGVKKRQVSIKSWLSLVIEYSTFT